MNPLHRLPLTLSYALALVTWIAGASQTHAVIQYANDAESGLAGLNDQTHASYPLIQSTVVGEGAGAFHLAHPAAPTDEWFSIVDPITPQADSKLFFLSRLGTATSAQVAKVQISSTSNFTSPTTIYTQAGIGQPGEGSFTLKEVNLAPYAGLSRYFRFYYDFTGGSFFPQTSDGVGWYIDDIQIADQFQKNLYSIGNPSNEEQLYLEYINRARADAIAEAHRLANENAPGVQSAYSFFGITGANIVNQFTASVANGFLDQYAQPLSFNAALQQASELHSQDLLINNQQGHVSYGSVPPFSAGWGPLQRVQAFGYSGGVGENVYSFNENVAEGHAGFDVDWGNVSTPSSPDYNPAFAGQGMQNPAGHRHTIHNDDYKEIGVGLIAGTGTGPNPVGPYLVTQDFGNPGSATFITGVVYEDLNSNNFYDLGEGRSGVRVDVAGSPFYALSTASGGYSVPVSGDGVHNVTFSGGGWPTFNSAATVSGLRNVKVDYLVSAVSYAADFNNDDKVDGDDLLTWKNSFGPGAGADANDDGDSDGDDFLVWQRQLGLGVPAVAAGTQVPEPATAVLVIPAIAALGARVRRTYRSGNACSHSEHSR